MNADKESDSSTFSSLEETIKSRPVSRRQLDFKMSKPNSVKIDGRRAPAPTELINYIFIYRKNKMIVPKTLLMIALAVMPPVAAFSQDVIVEATPIYSHRIDPSRSATVIESSQIQQLNAQSVADVLRTVPGIEVVRQGGAGQTTSVFIRGARSESTLVLIDGAEANDAMSPSCGFDFSAISAENIERIEVYRGPQSVRFGAGALGGVINIVTKEGRRKPQLRFMGEAGSYATHRESISAWGQVGAFGYSAAGDYFSTQGYSAASERSGNTEPDGAKIASGSLKLGFAPRQSAMVETTLRYTNADVAIDSYGGSGGDDPNNQSNAKQLVATLKGSERFFGDHVKATLGGYFSEVDRRTRNEPDPVNATDSSDHFLTENRKIQSDIEWILSDEHTLRFDLSYRDESGISVSAFNGVPSNIPRKSQSVAGESVTYLFESETWFFDAGVRHDQSSAVGGVSSLRSSLGRHFSSSGTKAYLSYGTGYKLPSLYQLYSSYGDETLKPENSSALEATIEQKIENTSTLAFTAFGNAYRNMIDYNLTTNRYFNISSARTSGFEIQASTQIDSALQLRGSYAYLDTVDETTRARLLRRPLNVWTISADFVRDSFDLTARYSYRGERDDLDPTTFQRTRMNPYSLVSIGGSFKLTKILNAHARIENLFNEKFEEVAGYGTPERSVYVGLSGGF